MGFGVVTLYEDLLKTSFLNAGFLLSLIRGSSKHI